MSGPRIYIIAGEASGDLHGSNLMKALIAEEPEAEFRYWGGDLMSAVTEGRVKHIKDLAFMGFIEVVANLRTILGNMKFCKEDILEFKPDALVLIDYPGFNLRIAEWAHKNNIEVHYYISPQVWAWKQSRVKKIKKYVDHMYVILPFEKPFYQNFDYEVEFVGHPLIDAIDEFESREEAASFRHNNGINDNKIIAVLPGSRKQEIKVKLPIMMEALRAYEQFEIVIAGAPSIPADFYKELIDDDAKVVFGQTYSLLSNASFAVVTSGTATLETALFGVPEVVCYKGSAISYQIARQLVNVDYISLVNLIMDEEVVKELIQRECNSKNIRAELDKLINDNSYRENMLNNYDKLRARLGAGGASQKVAQSLLKTIR